MTGDLSFSGTKVDPILPTLVTDKLRDGGTCRVYRLCRDRPLSPLDPETVLALHHTGRHWMKVSESKERTFYSTSPLLNQIQFEFERQRPSTTPPPKGKVLCLLSNLGEGFFCTSLGLQCIYLPNPHNRIIGSSFHKNFGRDHFTVVLSTKKKSFWTTSRNSQK